MFTSQFQKKLLYTIGIILVIFLLKPSIFFKPNGLPRQYGIGYDFEGYKKTLFNFQFCIIIIVLFVYILV